MREVYTHEHTHTQAALRFDWNSMTLYIYSPTANWNEVVQYWTFNWSSVVSWLATQIRTHFSCSQSLSWYSRRAIWGAQRFNGEICLLETSVDIASNIVLSISDININSGTVERWTRDTERDDNKPDTLLRHSAKNAILFLLLWRITPKQESYTHTCTHARTHARTCAHTHSILVESGYTALYYVRRTELLLLEGTAGRENRR